MPPSDEGGPRRETGAAENSIATNGKGTAETDTFGPFPSAAGHAAEAAALGACLHGTSIARRVVEALTVDDFDRGAHKTLYEAIAALLDAGEDVDLMTVTDYLGCAGQLDECGGPAALADLLMDVPVPEHWRSYVGIVAREARRRRGIRLLRRAIERLEAGEDPAVVAAEVGVAT